MAGAAPAPLRRLLPIAGLVLAAHVALLQARPGPAPAPSERPAPAFATRVVMSTAVAAPPAPRTADAEARTESVPAPATPQPVVRAAIAIPRGGRVAAPTLAAPQDRTQALLVSAPSPTESPPVLVAAAPRTPTTETARPAAQPVAVPHPMRLRYDVVAQARGLHLNGYAVLQWRHDGARYEASLEMGGPLLPTRTQRSRGRISDEGLAPDYFSDRGRSEQATHFEREQGRLVFSNNRPEAPLPAGVQDRLSVVLQVAALVAGQPARFTPGRQFELPTASTREAETWLFSVEGEEDLVLPGGAVRALKLQRQPRREFDQKIELWLAPGMDYAPVRLRLTNPNGDTVDQRWASTDRG